MKFHKHHSKEQAEIERLTAELNLYKKVFEHIYEKPITHIYDSIKNSEPHIYASIKKSICADILPICQADSAQAQTPPPLPPPRHIPPRMVYHPLKITSEV
jgi:hypothetical protein